MRYKVVKTYEVLAENEEKAKEVLTKLEEKNVQNFFLKSMSTTIVEAEDRPRWKLW